MRRIVFLPENSPDIIKSNMILFEKGLPSIGCKCGKNRIAVLSVKKELPSTESPIGSMTVQIRGEDDWDIMKKNKKKGGRNLFLAVVDKVNQSGSRNGANRASLAKYWEYNPTEGSFEKTFAWG